MSCPSDEPSFAWQGLTVPLRPEWRPLRIEGNWEQGAVTIGDRQGAVFSLRWLRPAGGVDGAAWIAQRTEQTAAGQSSPRPPQPAGFTAVNWIRGLAVREEARKTVWWGYAPTPDAPKDAPTQSAVRPGVLVEAILTDLAKPETNAWFIEHSLPRLQAQPENGPLDWRIYSARFATPPGFRLQEHRLASGDLALRFKRGRREGLLLRQVYPAGLALARRNAEGWLADRPFLERRRFRGELTEPRPQTLMRTGWKRIPFPFGPFAPRRCTGLLVEAADRLFMAEAEGGEETQAMADRATRAMQEAFA